MKLRPIHNSIIFEFVDGTSKGLFQETTDWGFTTITSKDTVTSEQGKTPRWGKVLSVGALVKDIEIGDEILIEPLMWTEASVFEGQKIWRTDDTKVIAIKE